MEEIRDLSKQIGFNNLIDHYKSITFLSFKGPLKNFKNIKEGNLTLEKAEEEQKEFNLEFSKILKGSKKSENQQSAMNYIKILYELKEKVIKPFDDYSRVVSEAKYKRK